MKKLRVRLQPSMAEQKAKAILDGEMPPQTDDLDVVRALVELAKESEIEIECYRASVGRVPEVVFTPQQVKISLERDIDMRPIWEPEA